MENHMERKLREISGSLVVTIPKQICDLYKMQNGDMLEIEPIGIGELRLRKKMQ
jgi:bifunctional DNA-binding transcriptional regulator/antitoxin component of YhaV-PrlF toxin-antitoxin module